MDDVMTVRLLAQKKLAGMNSAVRSNYLEAWAAVDASYKKSAPKGSKVFEVHQVLETARERFFVALVAGETPSGCVSAASGIRFS